MVSKPTVICTRPGHPRPGHLCRADSIQTARYKKLCQPVRSRVVPITSSKWRVLRYWDHLYAEDFLNDRTAEDELPNIDIVGIHYIIPSPRFSWYTYIRCLLAYPRIALLLCCLKIGLFGWCVELFEWEGLRRSTGISAVYRILGI